MQLFLSWIPVSKLIVDEPTRLNIVGHTPIKHLLSLPLFFKGDTDAVKI